MVPKKWLLVMSMMIALLLSVDHALATVTVDSTRSVRVRSVSLKGNYRTDRLAGAAGLGPAQH